MIRVIPRGCFTTCPEIMRLASAKIGQNDLGLIGKLLSDTR